MDRPGLRERLRVGTREAHDRIDAIVSDIDLASPAAYRRFLAFQYSARLPVEQWLAAHSGGPVLPSTTPLIAHDLAALGAPIPDTRTFEPPSDDGAIGIVWALAGSHLGNRAILARLKKQPGFAMPTAFLSDERMQAVWRTLLPQLDASHSQAETQQAIAAANAVFAHFEQALDLLHKSRKSLAA